MKSKVNMKIPVIVVSVLCVMSIIFFWYKNSHDDVQSQSMPMHGELVNRSDEKLTLEEKVGFSTHIADAEYLGYETDEYGAVDFLFKPVNTILGDFDEEVIRVSASENIDESCTEGSIYNIFLEKINSVYNQYQRYALIESHVELMSSDSEEWESSHDEIENIISSMPSLHTAEADEKDFTLSEDMDEILNYSAHIFKVRVDSVFDTSTIAPTTVYECSVTATLKSEPVNDNGNLLINMFNDTVEIGKEYIVLLSDAQESAPVYTLSSRNSVYTSEQAEQIPQLKELLSNAEEYTTVPDNKTNEEILAEEQAYIEEQSIE